MTKNADLWSLGYTELRKRQARLLAPQLRYVAGRSEFLTQLWQARGNVTGVPSVAEFGSLPLVSKQDLRDALDEGWLGTHLACEPADVAHIYATSGTSGQPTYFGLTERDYQAWLRIFVRGVLIGGARRGDIVLHAFGMSRGYAGAVPMVRAFESMGTIVLPFGAEAGSARLCNAIDRLRPTLLYASPSMLRHVARRYEEESHHPLREASIQRIITGGEPGAGDPASKRELSRLWGAQVREAGGGSDICPLMWTECDAQEGLHFVAGDEVLFELIDPATEQVLDPDDGIEGEIVYTHLKRQANPLVRMRHGDIVELHITPCSCGRATPRIRFRGRSDDMVIARGVKIFPSSVQSVVSEFAPQLTGIFAIRKPKAGTVSGPLEVVCEVDTSVRNRETVRQRFEQRAREMLGVRVECSLVRAGALSDERTQKGRWILRTEEGAA